MRCKRIVGALALLVASLVTVILFSSLSNGPTRAQQTLAPRSDYVNALWVAGSDGIVKLATADGTILFEIPEAEDVRAVAVDAQRGILWAYSQGTLYAYSFNGTLLRSVPVFPDDDNDDDDDDDEDDAHIALTLNSQDGTVWLGVHKTVFHFDAQGRLLTTIALPDNVQALTLGSHHGPPLGGDEEERHRL